MHQVLFTVPGLGIPVHGFGLMLSIAVLAAMSLAAWRAKREGLDPEQVYDLAIWVLVGGLAGARAFWVIQYWHKLKNFADIFKVWEGGIVLYGSAIGATAALLLYRRLRPFPLWPMLDAIAPAVALGIAIGRVGCFLNGCCYGDLCNLPWAVTFPKGTSPWVNHVDHGLISSQAARSLPIHPTQLYSTIDGLLIMALLNAYFPIRKRDGEVTALLLLTYPITRFLIEQIRNDEVGFVAGMTISQTISVVFLICGVAFWFYLQKKPAGRYADMAEPVSSVLSVQ